MDIKTVNSNLEYQVLDDRAVKLIIESGDVSLLSASVAALEGRQEQWHLGNETKLEINLDVGNELRGRRLRSISTVADLIGGANMTRISYTLSGGSGTQNFAAELPVANEQDIAIYRAEIKFI